MSTHSQIQRHANNSEIKNSQNKSHEQVSEHTVINFHTILVCFQTVLLQTFIKLMDYRSISLVSFSQCRHSVANFHISIDQVSVAGI